ncbi:MAG: tetratricopeptide repeat protein [Pseudomonadota bacterium]
MSDADRAFWTKLAPALAAEDWSTAERLLRARAKKPRPPAAVLFNLGQVLLRSEKADQSGAWYRKALAVDPNHVAAWCELGAWSAERDDLDAAMEAFDRALRLAPDDADALRGLGRAALRRGDWATAETAFRRLPEEDAEARMALYRIAAEQDAADLAERRRALATDPALRPALLKTLTRTARGRLPLRPKDL